MNGYATAGGGAMMTMSEKIQWMSRPGNGTNPVGQFDAQNLFPPGRGIPSFATSWFVRAAVYVTFTTLLMALEGRM